MLRRNWTPGLRHRLSPAQDHGRSHVTPTLDPVVSSPIGPPRKLAREDVERLLDRGEPRARLPPRGIDVAADAEPQLLQPIRDQLQLRQQVLWFIAASIHTSRIAARS